MISKDRILGALLTELANVTSNEERDAHDPTWLRGYVAGIAAAGQIAVELDRGQGGEEDAAREPR